jgi:bacterial/archaeal transporter family-2 protein
MDKSVAVVATAIVGGLIALQAPINAVLGSRIGSLQAGFVSFAIGTMALCVIAAFARGGLGQIGEVRGISWYYLTGGLLGAVYVTTVLITVKELGAGPVVAATVAGQLTIGMVVDQFGWLGVDKEPITVEKIVGVLLLCLGVFLLVRE